MRPRPAILAALVALGAAPLSAQVRTTVRINPIFESYSFDAGLPFTSISEFTVPVGVDVQLGRFGALALSTGFASVHLTSADKVQLPDQQVSGLLDTELRFSRELVPGKLVLIVNGALPTGVKTVEQNQLAILGALSSDVIGFAASSLGSGGNMGGGLVGAIPVGSWALGLGATYKLPLSYTPVVGRTDALKPGAELRLRTGLEGPLGRTTYVRLAGIYARTSKDAVGASTLNGVGNRLISYGSLSHGFGETQATFYMFDVLRGDPQLESTAAGTAILPRGNLLAAGVRVAYPMGPGVTLTPNLELRNSAAADSAGPGPLERLGHSLRLGADLRRDIGKYAAEARLGYTTGYVVTGGTAVSLGGLRLAVQVELHP